LWRLRVCDECVSVCDERGAEARYMGWVGYGDQESQPQKRHVKAQGLVGQVGDQGSQPQTKTRTMTVHSRAGRSMIYIPRVTGALLKTSVARVVVVAEKHCEGWGVNSRIVTNPAHVR
jgi:hypothetical protein